LQVTVNLAKSTFGLPLYQDLERDQAHYIAATLTAAVS
jgi:dTDP-4-amino-4,6-dideoxygalactose transaminase